MSDSGDRALGRIEGEMDALKADVAELKRDMKSLLEQVATAKGGWKVLVAAASSGGAIGALAMKFGTWLLAVPIK